MLVSADDAVLADIKIALQFVGRPNLQKQGRAAHILLRYAPSYATFSAADHIPVPRGEDHLTALIFPNFKSLKEIGLEASDSKHAEEQVADQITEDPDQLGTEVDEALNSAFEEAGLNLSDPPSTSGRGDVFEDIFTNLGDLPRRLSRGYGWGITFATCVEEECREDGRQAEGRGRPIGNSTRCSR